MIFEQKQGALFASSTLVIVRSLSLATMPSHSRWMLRPVALHSELVLSQLPRKPASCFTICTPGRVLDTTRQESRQNQR